MLITKIENLFWMILTGSSVLRDTDYHLFHLVSGWALPWCSRKTPSSLQPSLKPLKLNLNRNQEMISSSLAQSLAFIAFNPERM
jgi:hypothetical protein